MQDKKHKGSCQIFVTKNHITAKKKEIACNGGND